jgi:endonuclease III
VGPAERAAGERPDPYRVWLSEIMLQQTTVAAVRDYFHRFTARWPDIHALAAADDAEVMAEWAGLGYYARARNLIACARAVAAAGGRFPAARAGLQALPGIGPYTAAAIAAIAFDRPETVVDGNVERVTARLFAVTAPLPGAKPRLARLAATLTPARRPGDFAQAMMDLGATICTPRAPAAPTARWPGSAPPGRRASPPTCRPGAEGGKAHAPRHRLYRATQPTARCCWRPARRAACWAGCPAFRRPTGPRRRPRPRRRCRRLAVPAGRGAPHLHPFPSAPAGRRSPRSIRRRGPTAAASAPASTPPPCRR